MPGQRRPTRPLNMFAEAARTRAARHAPLAARMRPQSLDEFVGQEHIIGAGKVLRRAIEEDKLPSIVLWGPPGSGKTTLARIIAATNQSHFEPVSAVASGVADLRRVDADAAGAWVNMVNAPSSSSTDHASASPSRRRAPSRTGQSR
jgi:putative ATPase